MMGVPPGFCERCGAPSCDRPHGQAYDHENWNRCEDEAWRDAYYIAWVGASNPRAVARTLTRHRAVLGSNHVAVRAIAGHLAFLQGESLGPDIPDLNEVEAQAWRLGLL